MSYPVATPEDRFSHDEAHIVVLDYNDRNISYDIAFRMFVLGSVHTGQVNLDSIQLD